MGKTGSQRVQIDGRIEGVAVHGFDQGATLRMSSSAATLRPGPSNPAHAGNDQNL